MQFHKAIGYNTLDCHLPSIDAVGDRISKLSKNPTKNNLIANTFAMPDVIAFLNIYKILDITLARILRSKNIFKHLIRTPRMVRCDCPFSLRPATTH